MAYQNVGTPRFYIDYFSYWKSIGLIESVVNNTESGNINGSLLGLDPVSPFTVSGTTNINGNFLFGVDLKENINLRTLESINYIGYLGHTLGNLYGTDATATAIRMNLAKKTSGDEGDWGTDEFRGACTQQNVLDGDGNSILAGDTEVINAEHINLGVGLDNYTSFNNSGFSLSKTNANQSVDGEVDRFYLSLKQYNSEGAITDYADINPLWNLNCITMGHFYDMPVSPDLDVKLEVEFDGYDTVQTIGGSTLTNIRYAGNPKWAGKNAWEIGDSNSFYKRNGRRGWSLKFSFISDNDIFSSNYSSSNYLNNSTGYDSDDITQSEDGNVFTYTLADDNSFVAKVLNFIGNGQRFVFQSDNTNNNPDQFAICVLDQDSLTISQKAFKSYEISLKIKEVW